MVVALADAVPDASAKQRGVNLMPPPSATGETPPPPRAEWWCGGNRKDSGRSACHCQGRNSPGRHVSLPAPCRKVSPPTWPFAWPPALAGVEPGADHCALRPRPGAGQGRRAARAGHGESEWLRGVAEVLHRGWEGMVAKDPAAPYVGGRTLKWLKVKQPGYRVEERGWKSE